MKYAVKDLKAGMVVWESCQQGNARLTVMEDARLEDGYWSAPCRTDNGGVVTVGERDGVNAYCLPLYDAPMYIGAAWVCAPENIPAWAKGEAKK